MIATVLKTGGLIFVAFILVHWLTAGQDEIIEGPPETPDYSIYLEPGTKP